MIETLKLFEGLKDELIELLKGLNIEDWKKNTCIKDRDVKDLVSHIIDTSVRRVSIGRDKHFSDVPKDFSHEGLISFIQNLNKTWIEATKRISPRILIELLKISEEELIDYLKELDLKEKALFPVEWAGEKEYSENWFDIAREYTEKWHHQMQIREALGKEGKLYSKRYFDPIIEIFAVALPYTYDKYNGDNFTLEIEIFGGSGRSYYIEKITGKTRFVSRRICQNKVVIEDKEFWKLVTNSKDRNKVKIEVEGDKFIGEHILTMVTVMS